MAFVARTAAALVPRGRTFGTTSVARKKATQAIKETLKSADKAVAGKIVDGIEVGEAATKKAKKIAEEMKGKAAERKEEVRGKSSEIAGGTKERKDEVK